jgi:serine O-acetyltransferase
MSHLLTVKELIESDCQRYYGLSSFKAKVKTKKMQAAFRYTVEYRKVHNYILKSRKGLGYYWHRYKLLKFSVKYGYQIGADTEIGPGFYMGHRGTVIVNGAVKIGANVNIATGVTIGQENRGERKGTPTIGNKVWIGSNSVIVGNIKIGDNVMVAPNTFINFDVPDNSVVIGSPAKIIPNKNATQGYIQHPYEG